MMGHKICFYGEIWLIISKLSRLPPLIWRTNASFFPESISLKTQAKWKGLYFLSFHLIQTYRLVSFIIAISLIGSSLFSWKWFCDFHKDKPPLHANIVAITKIWSPIYCRSIFIRVIFCCGWWVFVDVHHNNIWKSSSELTDPFKCIVSYIAPNTRGFKEDF